MTIFTAHTVAKNF